uniref:SAM domain-containing protein n=1 Tax=Ditylenchus dipsaci TaxID=166011 RepID=A0A915E266_9BILA
MFAEKTAILEFIYHQPHPGQEVVSRSCKKVAISKVPDMHQPRSVLVTAAIYILAIAYPLLVSAMNCLMVVAEECVLLHLLAKNTTTPAPAAEESTLAVNGPSNYCYSAAYSSTTQQPRALKEQGIARPSTRHTLQANTLAKDMGVDRQGSMNSHPVIINLRLEDHQSVIHSSFILMQTSNAGNRNSFGSTSSQTSSGFESGKTGSSTCGDLSNSVSSNSSGSCASSNIVTAVNPMNSPSSRISSSGSTTSAGRLSTYYTCLDEYCCDLTGIRNHGRMVAKTMPLQCLALFIRQGYDLISIFRITLEYLTTLGISKPADRKRLMQDIQQWNIVDNWTAHVTADCGISASDSGNGTSIQSQSNYYGNTVFVSPYMALDRRPFHQPPQNPQKKSSSLVNAKQTPIVTVCPNKQPRCSSLDQDLDDDRPARFCLTSPSYQSLLMENPCLRPAKDIIAAADMIVLRSLFAPMTSTAAFKKIG